MKEGWFDDWSWKDIGHGTLDLVAIVSSMFPGAGSTVSIVADVGNAIWYATEGKNVTAGLYLIMAIPVVGDIFAIPIQAALKLGGKGFMKVPGMKKAIETVIEHSAVIKKYLEDFAGHSLTAPAAKAGKELVEKMEVANEKGGAKAAAEVVEEGLTKEGAHSEEGLVAKVSEEAAEKAVKKAEKKAAKTAEKEASAKVAADKAIKARPTSAAMRGTKSAMKRVIPKIGGAIFNSDRAKKDDDISPTPKPDRGGGGKGGGRTKKDDEDQAARDKREADADRESGGPDREAGSTAREEPTDRSPSPKNKKGSLGGTAVLPRDASDVSSTRDNEKEKGYYWMSNAYEHAAPQDKPAIKAKLLKAGWKDSMDETRIRNGNPLNIISQRNKQLETLLFERLVKNAN